MSMIARSNLVRISWLFLLVPLAIYGLLYLHCSSNAEYSRELHRRRLVLWSITNRELSANKTIRTFARLGLLPDSAVVGRLNDTLMLLMDADNDIVNVPISTMASGLDDRALINLSRGNDNHEATNLREMGKGRLREDNVPETKMENEIIKKIKSDDGDLMNDDDEESEAEDDEAVQKENENAANQRAVPEIKVKRYVDERVDEHNYRYVHLPKHRCTLSTGKVKPVFVIFMVVTAPGNFKRRLVVRETYGNEKEWPAIKRGSFTSVFLLGTPKNATLQKLIDEEAAKYGDIVQEDFVDSYANLTLKTVMGLKWMTLHCRHASFMMKIDDDSMLNQGRFLWIFKNSTISNWTAAEALIGAKVFRNTSSKYYISEEYYPSPTYPPYLNGPGYIMSTDLGAAAYKAALTTPLFPWEDVFLGTCLKKLNVDPVVHRHFLWISDETLLSIKSEKSLVRRLRAYVVVSNLYPEYMRIMWTTCKIKIYEHRSRIPRHH
ncbi:beta-1,3-galactosyltransferase 1-like [Diadema antillarum]|uniref:beta-1,3-galactosyltransferase 1-like n=1 Tax=Diadema antillarum TaxID=105358 RepID=UPI003A8C1563